jgi:hypothetical protein
MRASSVAGLVGPPVQSRREAADDGSGSVSLPRVAPGTCRMPIDVDLQAIRRPVKFDLLFFLGYTNRAIPNLAATG